MTAQLANSLFDKIVKSSVLTGKESYLSVQQVVRKAANGNAFVTYDMVDEIANKLCDYYISYCPRTAKRLPKTPRHPWGNR